MPKRPIIKFAVTQRELGVDRGQGWTYGRRPRFASPAPLKRKKAVKSQLVTDVNTKKSA